MSVTSALDVAFETPRLIVRPWTPDDEAAFRAVYADPAVSEFLRLPGETHAELAARQLGYLKNPSALAPLPPGCGRWKLTTRSDDQVVGTLLLKPLPGSDDIEVGWHLARPAWGHGYATEAAAGALKQGFTVAGLPSIYAIVHPLNIRSQRVCWRLGMRSLGYTIRFHQLELALFAIDRDSWHTARPPATRIA